MREVRRGKVDDATRWSRGNFSFGIIRSALKYLVNVSFILDSEKGSLPAVVNAPLRHATKDSSRVSGDVELLCDVSSPDEHL
jgi:hypothetical protein